MSATMLVRAQSVTSRKSTRATLWWARIVCLSVFGPYVTGSARTEQIVVFASFTLILVVGWPQIVNARSAPPMPFIVIWLGLDLIMLIGAVWRPFDPGFYGPQPPSHALASYLLPVALITLTWFWTLSAAPADLIRAVAPVIIVGMSVNALISIAQLATRNVVVLGMLPRFWDAPGSPGSVAVNAAGNGRFTGIFDQPAEAGVAYGIALFCLIYLAQRPGIRTGTAALCAALLITGGTLTVSKIFLLGAVPLATMMVLRSPRGRVRVVLWGAAAAGTLRLFAAARVLPAWRGGSGMLLSLLHPSGSLTVRYTAGRYGTSSGLGPVAADVLHASPWYGFGAGGLDAAYDSLWVQALVLTGIAGLIIAVGFLLMLAIRLWHLRGVTGHPEWNLAAAALVLAIGASSGLPALTANRDSTLLWLIIGVLVTAALPRSSGRHLNEG